MYQNLSVYYQNDMLVNNILPVKGVAGFLVLVYQKLLQFVGLIAYHISCVRYFSGKYNSYISFIVFSEDFKEFTIIG